MKTEYRQHLIGIGNSLEFTTVPFCRMYRETRVDLNGIFLCKILYSDIDSFIKEFYDTLNKFAI